MEPRLLRHFATVARALYFTRPAARLSVAQPALSRRGKQIEEELGVVFFARTTRALRSPVKTTELANAWRIP